MDRKKLDGLIGLSRKAGKLELGTQGVESAIFKGRAKLVIIDDGASKNTKNRFLGFCEDMKIAQMGLPAGMLSDILRRENQLLAAVTDEGFAAAIDKAIRAKTETKEKNEAGASNK